jgi:hypothetical protein
VYNSENFDKVKFESSVKSAAEAFKSGLEAVSPKYFGAPSGAVAVDGQGESGSLFAKFFCSKETFGAENAPTFDLKAVCDLESFDRAGFDAEIQHVFDSAQDAINAILSQYFDQ